MRKIKRNKKGFTLIELIVVIAVIAILAAVLLPRFTGFTSSAKQSNAKTCIKNYSDGVVAMLAEHPTEAPTAAKVKDYTGLKQGLLYFQKVGDDASSGDFYFTLDGITGSFDYDTGDIKVPDAPTTLGSGG